jgi:hypothetical protein
VIVVLAKRSSSMNKTSVANVVFGRPTESAYRMHILQLHCTVLTLAETECDRDTTVVLVMYSVQKHGMYLYKLLDVTFSW